MKKIQYSTFRTLVVVVAVVTCFAGSVSAGISAHYSLSGNLYDDSGNEYNGTFEGGNGANSSATFVSDSRFGTVLDFDGTDDRISLGNVHTLRSNSWSVSMWVKTPATLSAVALIGKNNGDAGFDAGDRVFEITGNGTWGSLIEADAPVGNFALNGNALGGQVTKQSTIALDDGTWHMLTAVHDNSVSATDMTLYIDGVAQTGGSSTLDNNAKADVGGFYLGFSNYSNGGAGYLTGQMAEVNFYNVAIDAATVKALHDAGIKAHYSLSGNLYDDSGYGYSGTFEGISGANSSATFVSDSRFGTVLDFDGTDDRISLGNIHHPLQSNSWSISMWVKTAATANTVPLLGKNNGDAGFDAGDRVFEITGNGTWGSLIEADAPVGNFALNGNALGGQVTKQSTIALDDGTWHMLTAVHDNSVSATDMTLYIDGVAQTGGSSTLDNNAKADVGGFYLGFSNYSNGGAGYLTGQMAEVNFYNVVIDAATVKALHDAFIRGTVISIQ